VVADAFLDAAAADGIDVPREYPDGSYLEDL
jgi:hypothetical protein